MSAGAPHDRGELAGNSARLRICIITTAIVSDNPRVVKEADALTHAGHDVRVVAYQPRNAEALARDAATMRGKKWRLLTVTTTPAGFIPALRWAIVTFAERSARPLIRAKIGIGSAAIVDAAISKHRAALRRAAVAEGADLVIAHHAPALPAAASAARQLAARLAFDAEDLHSGDPSDTMYDLLKHHLITATEARYLPLCDRVVASSPGIAEALARRYGIARPQAILNAFPREDRLRDGAREKPGAPLSLYWYSQVIGLDRGLQDAIRALPLVNRPVELHLRGAINAATRDSLIALASGLGVGRALHFHPLAPPPDLAVLAAEHDIGLALEQPSSLNRRLCIPNKLMLYFTAGIAVVATDTPGQRLIIERSGEAGRLYAPGDHRALACVINGLADSPEALARAKAGSRALGRGEFSWEHEAPRLVAYLTGGKAVDRASPSPVGAA